MRTAKGYNLDILVILILGGGEIIKIPKLPLLLSWAE
jgi:hypothetical protein